MCCTLLDAVLLVRSSLRARCLQFARDWCLRVACCLLRACCMLRAVFVCCLCVGCDVCVRVLLCGL